MADSAGRGMPGMVATERKRGRRTSTDWDLPALLQPDPVLPIVTRINLIARNYSSPLYEWVQRNYGLSRPEYVTVYNVKRSPGISARDIAIRTGFKRNTVSTAVHRLIRLDMLERRRDTTDDRRYHLHLRPRGEVVYEAVIPRFAADETAALARLDAADRKSLERLLGIVLERLVEMRHQQAVRDDIRHGMGS